LDRSHSVRNPCQYNIPSEIRVNCVLNPSEIPFEMDHFLVVLRMLDLLLRSFIRTGIAFFLTSSCVCSDLPAAILFKQPRAKHYKNVASYNHPNPSYMQSKRILQSLPYLQWTMFIGRQPYQEGNQSLLQHSINCFKASYRQIMRNYLHSFQLCVTKESFDNVT
jgi:hypothetical protein